MRTHKSVSSSSRRVELTNAPVNREAEDPSLNYSTLDVCLYTASLLSRVEGGVMFVASEQLPGGAGKWWTPEPSAESRMDSRDIFIELTRVLAHNYGVSRTCVTVSHQWNNSRDDDTGSELCVCVVEVYDGTEDHPTFLFAPVAKCNLVPASIESILSANSEDESELATTH